MTDSVYGTIEGIVSSAEFSILSTLDEDGFPHTRAMLFVRKRNGWRDFYFSTNTSSLKVRHAQSNDKACVYFFDKKHFIGAMFIGSIAVRSDSDSRRLVWQDGDEQYYPLGVDDPDYSVLHFTPRKVRFYSSMTTVELPVT